MFSYLPSLLHLKARIWAMEQMQITKLTALLAQPSSPSDWITKESHTHARIHMCVCVYVSHVNND